MALIEARLLRGLGILRGKLVLRGCRCGHHVNVGGPVRVVAKGAVTVGDRVQFWPGMIPTELLCEAGAELVIGAGTSFNYGVCVHASDSVRIGRRCLFASMTSVRDRAAGLSAPVVIEDDVWVAFGASIEPGVRIGAGSVVAAGAVVRRDVPPSCLALGNPCVVRPLPAARPAEAALGLGLGR